MTMFAFDKGEEISTHESSGDTAVGCIILTIEKLAFDIYEINILQALCPAKFAMAYWCKVCYNLYARAR